MSLQQFIRKNVDIKKKNPHCSEHKLRFLSLVISWSNKQNKKIPIVYTVLSLVSIPTVQIHFGLNVQIDKQQCTAILTPLD